MFLNCGAEKTLESPLESKEIKPVNVKGNQPWILFGRTDAEASILWLPDVNRWLTEKDPDAGKDWRQKEKRVTENDTVEWQCWFTGHELGQTPGDGEGQRSLGGHSPRGREESDTTWETKQQRTIKRTKMDFMVFSKSVELSQSWTVLPFMLYFLASLWSQCC